ncbi:MAG: bifunctional 2-C-methyl-D-erythritol 4-phosphate cytidylyltransferase/2-C-methyl-D-erythritol 2,4-cyclodiphosphate synthase [Nitratireductor sp.]|nr:bifunctional 2-C-methyl-D-erythritol 4-phosphate cytidylyltransferase/2-C-methyl-D-erythritol 2,4-cyclodiphosphate synthase [Nitratireductor sp.]
MKKVVALIVAAGRGERFGSGGGPKQYRTIGGSSILQHSVNAFLGHDRIAAVQVVIHADDRELYDKGVVWHERLLEPVIGGASRQESVHAGLRALSGRGFDAVLIHDAARPFVSAATISGVCDALSPGTGAIAAQPVTDTIKTVGNPGAGDKGGMRCITGTLPRESLMAAQTPQGFVFDDIIKAHDAAAKAGHNDMTDDAAVAEASGIAVVGVPSPASNFKITMAQDLQRAEMALRANEPVPDIRSATGYDVHQLEAGDHVTLCGIRIPHHQRLKGHSDADVGLHALTDALLGTIGAGDIGSHFPPSDPQWRGASSDRFLEHALALVREAGGTITNLDVSLICEAPKIGPHRDTMRMRIAEIAGIDLFRVSVKATTNEGIGFIGREEGIAAIATATAVFRSIGGTDNAA